MVTNFHIETKQYAGVYVEINLLGNIPWSKITDTPTTLSGYGITDIIAGTGTVTYVGLEAPSFFDVTGSPITTSGTLALSLNNQAANSFLAAPSGIVGTPSFRAITATDLPSIPYSKLYGVPSTSGITSTRLLTINGNAQDLSQDRVWDVGNVFTTSSYANPSWLSSIAWNKITSTPTSLTGYGITDAVNVSRKITVNGNEQDLSADRVYNVGNIFTTSSYTDPSWLSTLHWNKITNTPTSLTGYGITDPILLNTRNLSINGIQYDLTADRSWLVGDIFTTSAYVNPSWLSSLPWSKITSTPTSSAGYGILDSLVYETRLLTINGNQQSLAANRTWSVGDVFTTSSYINPDWITSLDYSKLTNVPATSGTGTVYYAGLAMPSIFSVANTPIVSSGTFNVTLANQLQNLVFASPNGSTGIPTFRSVVNDDITDLAWSKITSTPTTIAGYNISDALSTSRQLTINGNTQNLSADRTWSVGDVFTTSSYVNPDWLVSLPWSKITDTPTTVLGYGIVDGLSTSRTITINGLTQDLSANRTWDVGNVFTTSSYADPTWLTSLAWSKITSTPTTLLGYGITDAYTKTETDNRYAPISISGTLKTVGLALPSIFTVQNSPLTGPGGTISGVLTSQTQNTVFSAPNGSSGTPTFRTLVLADLPTISFANIASTPTTIAGYGITDAYTKTQSDNKYIPSGLLPPLAIYFTSSGQINFVAHSGMVLDRPYLAGSGTLVYEKANAATQTTFAVTNFPVILTFNDVFRVTCSANIGTFRSATFPRIA